MAPTPIREASPEELPFLAEMLYQAAFWRDEHPRPPREEALARPELARYLAGWGRPGDVALVALDSRSRPIGAAWYRLFPVDEPGYGFVDEATPEFGIAVTRAHRGRGVGRALLEAVIERARGEGRPALSLSVEPENPAVRLYERFGFVRVGESGASWTMRLELA